MSVSKEYIAGFFDGEGCINMTEVGQNHQVALRIYLTNTNCAVLEQIQEVIGGSINSAQHQADWKVAYCLQLTFKAARRFLEEIGPLLVLKAPQARLATEFVHWMETADRMENFTTDYGTTSRRRSNETKAKEQWFKTQMHELNKKGTIMISEKRKGTKD